MPAAGGGAVLQNEEPVYAFQEEDVLGSSGRWLWPARRGHARTQRRPGPDPRLTPARWRRENRRFCQEGYSRAHRHTSGRLKARVYRAYGIPPGVHHYEMDHLIPLSLGGALHGADVAANLWPQSRDTQPWNAEVKDRLEWRLLHVVCGGQVPMMEAQQAIAEDWIAAYQRYCPTEAECPSYAATHEGRD